VLAFVPGTPQAQMAVQNMYLPQTAAVDRQQYQQPPVQYDGDPDFQPVDGTNLTYAINSPNSVVCDNGNYYCCYNAVWYSCNQPAGPWQICTSIPQDIYTIPPSCPIYPVTYCYIYGSTPQVVYCGYTPGYTGSYVYDGCVVYGTGYRYPTWAGTYYVPRPVTYGFAVQYNPDTGDWGFGFGIATGGGSLWIGESHANPVHGGGWFGYGGYRPINRPDEYRPHYLPPRQAPARDPGQWDVYQRRQDVHPDYPGTYRAQHPVQFVPRDDQHPQGHEDIYTDPKGNIYRHTDQGWEQHDNNNNWTPAQQPMAHPGKESQPVQLHQPQPQDQPRHDDHPAQPQEQPRQQEQPRPQDQPRPEEQPHQQPQPEQQHEAQPQPHQPVQVTPKENNNHPSNPTPDQGQIDRLERDRQSRQPSEPTPKEQPKETPKQEAPKEQSPKQESPSHDQQQQPQENPGRNMPPQNK
jgi:hypothetical protein